MSSKDNKHGLVHVATAPNPPIAAMWRDLLAQEGVGALIKCNDPLAVAYLVTSPVPCQILVPAQQAEQARRILESLIDEESSDGQDSQGGQDDCEEEQSADS